MEAPPCSERELLEPRCHPTTQTSPHFMPGWSGHHQARCHLVCGEQHPSSSSSSGLAHLPLPSSPGLSLTLGGTLRPTSVYAFILRRGIGRIFLRPSLWPGVYYLQPIAPQHAREVHRPILRVDLRISESVDCSAITKDKKL